MPTRLICTLGESPLPIALAAYNLLPKDGNAQPLSRFLDGDRPNIHLLTSQEVTAQPSTGRLKDYIEGLGATVKVHARPGADLDPSIVDALFKEASGAQGFNHTIANITGGTKIMSVRLLHAALNKGFNWQYINGNSGHFTGSMARQTYDLFPIDVWFKLQLPGHQAKVLLDNWARPRVCPTTVGDWAQRCNFALWDGGFLGLGKAIPIFLFLRYCGVRLEAVYALDQSVWDTLDQLEYRKNRSDIIRRLSGIWEVLGRDFCDMYLVLPDSYHRPQFREYPEFIKQAVALGLQVRFANFGQPFDLKNAASAQPPIETQPTLPSVPSTGWAEQSLVVLLGRQPMPAVVSRQFAIRYGGIGQVALVTTKDMRQVAQRLLDYWNSSDTHVLEVDANNPVNLEEKFNSISAERVMLDLTGGTTLMTSVAYSWLLARKKSETALYVNGSRVIEL